MTEIISVRFKEGGREYYFNPNGVQYTPGQNVIIETSRGIEFGECTKGNSMIDEMCLYSPLRPVLRAATPEDQKRMAVNKKKEAEAFAVCEKKILEHGLDMKLVDVEYNFEGNKILFYFTSDGRVDFRELVRDLAYVFHIRIELRQIGVRDEAKLLGGLGICGRPFCCSSFLENFQPVSIKMAKTQNLSLNPTKISGVCGRLMCCLKYEQDAYEDALKRCPKNESLVETPNGVGTICSVNLLRETVRVRLDSSPDTAETFSCEDLKVIRSGKGKRPEGYELPEPKPKQEHHLRNTPIPSESEEKKPEEARTPKTSRPQAKASPSQTEGTAKPDAQQGQKKKSRSQGNQNRQRTQKKAQKQPQDKQARPSQKPKAEGEAGKAQANAKPSGEQKPQGSSRSHHRRRSSGHGQSAQPAKNPPNE